MNLSSVCHHRRKNHIWQLSFGVIAAILCVTLNTGCVAGRRTIDLPITTTTSDGSKGEIAIDAVKDARHFENKPAVPSIPSVDGDINSVSTAQRATLIGRQRNTYGKAMGDIALPTNDTIMARAQLLIADGLQRRGYKVVPAGQAGDGLTVDVTEFWAWFTPGMWAVSFEARVTCKVAISRAGETKNFTVAGYGKNSGQVASDANWQLAYRRAFDDFATKLDEKLADAGL